MQNQMKKSRENPESYSEDNEDEDKEEQQDEERNYSKDEFDDDEDENSRNFHDDFEDDTVNEEYEKQFEWNGMECEANRIKLSKTCGNVSSVLAYCISSV